MMNVPPNNPPVRVEREAHAAGPAAVGSGKPPTRVTRRRLVAVAVLLLSPIWG